VDEFSTIASHFKSITVTDEATGKVLANTKTTSLPDDKFKVTETKKSITLRLKKKDKDDQPVSLNNVSNSNYQDKSLQFGDAAYQYYFTYAKTTVDEGSDDFNKLIDAIIARYNSTGYCKVYLNCSASKVPVNPAKFKDNAALAKVRSSETEAKIIRGLKAKGFDVSKIIFTSNYNVKGPDYRSDYIENRSEYERWQYVKVFLLEKK
jgi:hypothetical protein